MNGAANVHHSVEGLSTNGKATLSGSKTGVPRKLTKNEKRRQKIKQRKSDASFGDAMEKKMMESNGVAVASWPPPEEPKPMENIQASATVREEGYTS